MNLPSVCLFMLSSVESTRLCVWKSVGSCQPSGKTTEKRHEASSPWTAISNNYVICKGWFPLSVVVECQLMFFICSIGLGKQ